MQHLKFIFKLFYAQISASKHAQVRETVNELIGVSEKPSVSHRMERTREVRALREKLRPYLEDPQTERPHKSLSGNVLDDKLVHFSAHSKGNRDIYLDEYAAGEFFLIIIK